MNAVETAQAIAAFMKENGYKKRALCWKKRGEDIALAVSIQRSYYSPSTWYINFGATVLKLNDIDSFQAADYPIRSRLDGWKLTLDQIKYAVSLWEEKYGSVTKLARAAVEGRLPALSDGNMIRQLTSGEYFIIALNSGS